MDIIINADCSTPAVSETSLLKSQGLAALNLLASLGYERHNPPLADLLRRMYQLEGDWLIISLIHWEATHNDAMIVTTGKDLEITETESKLMFQLLFNYLAEEGTALYYHDATTWLMSVNQKPIINAPPVHQMVNKSLMPALAKLDSSMYWQKFFTECQMLFAAQAQAQSVLNGVWIWGGGALKVNKSLSICADESCIPMARFCSKQVELYSPSVQLKKYQIILLNDFDNISFAHQEEIKKIPAHWYWNNTAYTHRDGSWFTRIWRRLTHAH